MGTALAAPPAAPPATVVHLRLDQPYIRPPALARLRVGSVDVLRGLVMVIMTLDHVRAYFSSARFDPMDVGQTTAALYFTRWITHFCAPVFVLLAGTSAWMAGRRRTRPQLARFLVTRGLWLIALEFTVVSFAWYFNLRFGMGAFAQVIWAIGVSMIALAGLIFLPRWALVTVAVALMAGHNLLDGITPEAAGALAPLWIMLHVEAPLPQLHLFVVYPVLPWIGVMAAGYALGPVLEAAPDARRRWLYTLGGAATALFLFARLQNGYGDPSPWTAQPDPLRMVFDFFNVAKYPPSLLYLAMTLGPALLVLAALERAEGRAAGWLRTLGRVPLFYYVAHLYLIHALALAAAALQGVPVGRIADVFFNYPEGYGFGLGVVYAVWIAVVAALYPVSRWFAERKRRGTQWWWSYL